MTINLKRLWKGELRLLLALLQTEFEPKIAVADGKVKKTPAPIRPITKLARRFQNYVFKNKLRFVLPVASKKSSLYHPIEWVRDPDNVTVAAGVIKEERVEESTRQQWRRIRDEVRRVIEESRTKAFWGFSLPIMVPSKRVYVFRPENLILNWLLARLVANRQQFLLVPRCLRRGCGKAALRERSRKDNVYCSRKCKLKAMVKQRSKKRAESRAEQKKERAGPIPPVAIGTVRSALAPTPARSLRPRVPAGSKPAGRRG